MLLSSQHATHKAPYCVTDADTDMNNDTTHLLCMYWTTFELRPCRDNVMRTSAALFLQGTLWGGHQLVMALKSRVRSSLSASSSAGGT